MAVREDYQSGTVTVGAGAGTVTGTGTAWQDADIRPGDMFMANGWSAKILSVNSNTSLTLTQIGIRGGALSNAAYAIRYQSDGSRATAQARALIEAIGASGNVDAMAALTGAANTGLYFTGPGTMNTFPLTGFGRVLAGLTGANGRIPVATGAAAAAMRDIVGTVAQSGGIPTGALFERGSNANGDYFRFAGGLQICLRSVTIDLTTFSPTAYAWAATFNPSAMTVPFGGPASGFVSGDIPALGNLIIDTTSTTWRVRITGNTGTSTAATILLGVAGFWHT